jgi:hypothetical protein
MPFWIEGWVEVMCVPEDGIWQGVIKIAPLVSSSDSFSEAFFGLSKAGVSSAETSAIAARRGKPPNPSTEVRSEFEQIQQHESRYGPGELGGYTYATWREIADHLPSLALSGDSDWCLVFDLIRRLLDDDRFSDEHVRVVVWFNW